MSDLTIVQVQSCLDRLRAGDTAARDELIQAASGQLLRLTRKMLNHSPRLRRWEESGDVLQNAVLRLCRALAQAAPDSPAGFFRLAALQIRRELVDLARHHYGPQGGAAHHASEIVSPEGEGQALPQAGDLSGEPGRMALWAEFHQQVEQLPEEERQAFDLLFYQELSQAEAAEVAGVTERTIRSRWRNARLHLQETVGSLPWE